MVNRPDIKTCDVKISYTCIICKSNHCSAAVLRVRTLMMEMKGEKRRNHGYVRTRDFRDVMRSDNTELIPVVLSVFVLQCFDLSCNWPKYRAREDCFWSLASRWDEARTKKVVPAHRGHADVYVWCTRETTTYV